MISLRALAVLFSLAVPAMAASPVKDYATANDGDLLYTVNFNGDEGYTPALIVSKNTILVSFIFHRTRPHIITNCSL